MGDRSPPSGIFRFGVFELDPVSGELRRNGLKIKLQNQPLDVLVLLLESAGKVGYKRGVAGTAVAD